MSFTRDDRVRLDWPQSADPPGLPIGRCPTQISTTVCPGSDCLIRVICPLRAPYNSNVVARLPSITRADNNLLSACMMLRNLATTVDL